MVQTVSGVDLAIIGSGSAAFAAAIAAHDRGKTVVMVERGTVGGTCVNVGCIPSKALLAAAHAKHTAQTTDRFPGISASATPVDLPSLIAGKDSVVAELRADKYRDLAAAYGFRIMSGTASFDSKSANPTLTVYRKDGSEALIEADQYLVATGSAPWVPPLDGLAETGYLTSTTAMDLTRLPQSLIVVGGNAVGLEQAQLFARLGSHVTVIEARERLAPFEEPEISAELERALVDQNITVLTNVTLTAINGNATRYTVTARCAAGELQFSSEQLLMATGRRPATAGLNLNGVDVPTGPVGEIIVDEHLQTANQRIWAAGDVTGHPQYVYVAAAQGTLAVNNAFSTSVEQLRSLDYSALPRVTFTDPAIASVGMTEAQAIEADIPCDCRLLPLTLVPRALVERTTRGLVKLVAHAQTGRLLGAHTLAPSAGEIITAATYAISAGMTVTQVAQTWHPYLTASESLKLAAQSFTTDVTQLSCCAG